MFRPVVLSALIVASSLLAAAAPSIAQDKSGYTLFNPTPKDRMRDFNTDRPTKSNVPYTVDAGHLQYEGDFFVHSFDTTTTPDSNISSWIVGNPTFKLGLLNNLDVEVNFSAYNSIETITRSSGAASRIGGFGDTVTRFKLNLWGNDGGSTAFALIPFVKIPTAPLGIGNRYAEGGLIAPLTIALPGGFNSIVMAELDYLKNPNDNFYHVNIPALINVNRKIGETVTAYAEIYANWSTHREVRDLYTLDFALAWNPRPNFQLDMGVNIGLVPAAAPYQIYAGISQRF